MAARDRAAEITARKSRGPKAAYGFYHEFEVLRQRWAKIQLTEATTDDFFAIRAVTLLEVFAGAWIAQLIDHGTPYIENVAKLKMDFKFDLGLVQAIHGRTITLGDMVAHSLSFRSFGQVCGYFEALLNTNLIPLIAKTVDRRMTVAGLSRAFLGEKMIASPIITDVEEMERALIRLFEVRHILVHEFPQKEVYDRDEITVFLRSAEQFAYATNETLNYLLNGDIPQTTVEMKERASRALENCEAALAEVTRKILIDSDRRKGSLLRKSEKAWRIYRKAECDFHADVARGGTLAGLLALHEADALTRSRIEELKNYHDATSSRRSVLPRKNR